MIKRRADFSEDEDKTPFFLSTGDLMAALLLIFVLLLAATLLRLQQQYGRKVQMADTYKRMSEEYWDMSEEYKAIAETYRQLQEDLYNDLYDQFKDDIEAWHAVIDRDSLSIRFLEPDVLFGRGDDQVTAKFRAILDDFFPRYIGVLMADKYRDNIEEIRIEGHTSSEWESDVGADEAYFNNMALSQNRTRNTLRYCRGRIDNHAVWAWVRGKLTANGLSSSKLIRVDSVEDKKASRRVEFRVRTDAEQRIAQILRRAGQNRNAEARHPLNAPDPPRL